MMSKLLRGVVFASATLFSVAAHADLISDVQSNTGNRCGDNQISVAECPAYQDLAYNGGNGCINYTQYVFARNNGVAPLCSMLNAKVYIGWCRCGCFEEGTGILMEDGEAGTESIVPVEEIESVMGSLEAVTMASVSTVQDFVFESRPVIATTVGPEEKPLVVIVTRDGRRLGVTEQHAVLVSTGEMLKAVDLTTNHSVLDQSGETVGIERIERAYASGKVHNFLTDAALDPYGHLVVAEGLVVGDIMWQNTLAKMLGEVIIRQ